MVDEDDFLLSSVELELRVERRVQERLAAAGVPPAEAERVLAEALRYVHLRGPAPRELERRFLFAVDRECRRFEADLRRRVMEEIDALRAERARRRGEEP